MTTAYFPALGRVGDFPEPVVEKGTKRFLLYSTIFLLFHGSRSSGLY